MAERIAHLKVNIDPEAMNNIKRALYKNIAEAVEESYREEFWEDSESKRVYDVLKELWSAQ